MPKMTEDTLKAIVSAEVRRSIGYMGGEISREREMALNYYLGRPFGNEVEGRSSVVSTDVCDVIESVLPSLLKIFTSGDTVVKFEPQGPEDEKVAEQATDYCNWVFNRDNDGFTLLYDWMKDALMQKLGVLKIWWEEKKDETEETYEGLTDDEFVQLLQDDEVEPIEHTEYPATVLGFDPEAAPPPMPGGEPGAMGVPGAPSPAGDPSAAPGMLSNGGPPPMMHDVKVKRTKVTGRIKLACVPPEEFLVSPGTRDDEGAILMAHRKRTTRTALIEEGYPEDLVMEIPPYDVNIATTEAQSRWWNQEDALMGQGEMLDPSAEYIFVTESYIKVDYDGDGKAELRKVTVGGAGDGGPLLDNEVWEGPRPFYFLCPIRTPHVLIGRALSELAMDIQLINSTLLRGALDNMYLVNSPQTLVLDGQVNLDDLLTRRPGGVVRVKTSGAVEPMKTQPMMGQALQAIEYMNTVREVRTGVTRYNQGLDADSLNKTASGVSQIMNAAQQRIELIARIFAETGISKLFRGMLHLLSKHQNKPRMIRLRGEWVEMDPRQWNTSMDVTINVGLGTGNKDQMLGHLMTLLQLQEKVAMSGNPGGMIDPKKIYNSAEKVVENMGLKSVDPFFNDPDKVAQAQQATGQPPAPPPPSPEEIKSQQAMKQAAMDEQTAQLKAQADAAKIQADMQKTEQDRLLSEAEFQVKMRDLTAKMAQPVEGVTA